MEGATENTERKSGWKTTEFWVSLATGFFGILVTLGLFTPEQSADLINSISEFAGGIIISITAAGYAISRGLSKR